MGNGVSGNQGNLPSYGKRDVGATFDRKQHDWSEQARAQEVNTLSSNANAYSGAQLRGMKPEDDTRSSTYSDASNTGPSLSTEEDDARLDAYSRAPNRNQKSSVMKDDTQSVMNGNSRLRNRKKKEDRSLKTEESKTKGNMQVETDTGQTVYTQVEPETGQTAYIQVEPDTGQTAYALPSMAIPQPEEDRRVTLLSVDRAVTRQTEEETSIENSLSMLQLEDTVDRPLPELQVNNFRFKPETEIKSSERTDPASYEQQCYKGEPLAKPDMEIQGETYPSNKENLVHDDVPTRRYHTGKAEVDAKAGATRHLPCDPDATTKAEANAKADQQRHSSSDSNEINYRNDLNPMLNCRRIRLNNDQVGDKLPEIKTPRRKSTYTKRQNKQRQEDKKERRRAKRQGRRTGGETIPPQPSAKNINRSPATSTENTEGTPRHMTSPG